MVKYAYASISENGTVNGKAGDQTGREVKCRGEYNFGQTTVIHIKNKDRRITVGDSARKIAQNDHVGYSQNDRGSLYKILDKMGWTSTTVTKKCNTDCSNMAACCINLAYHKALIPTTVYSGNFTSTVKRKLDTKIEVKTYKKGMQLYKGDIVLKNGHVVVVYQGGKATV